MCQQMVMNLTGSQYQEELPKDRILGHCLDLSTIFSTKDEYGNPERERCLHLISHASRSVYLKILSNLQK